VGGWGEKEKEKEKKKQNTKRENKLKEDGQAKVKGWGENDLIPITLDRHDLFLFHQLQKRTSNTNNATHYVTLRKKNERVSSTIALSFPRER